jgi:hypothetical protein
MWWDFGSNFETMRTADEIKVIHEKFDKNLMKDLENLF